MARIIMILLVLMAVCGCGDNDPVNPPDEPPLENLAGDWEVVSMVADTLEHILPDNNVFWFFSETGEFCSLWKTAYGTYYPGNSGQVSTSGLVLTEQFENDQAIWRLSLSSGSDSLHAFIVEPDTLDIDSWFLVRSADAPEASCFSEELK